MNESRSFEGKLYKPRNIEGEPNTEALERIRGLEAALSSNPSFVGLAPVGPTMRGYNTDQLEIEAVILYDAKSDEEDTRARKELQTIIEARNKGLQTEGKKDVAMKFQNINPEAVIPPPQQGEAGRLPSYHLGAPGVAKFQHILAEMTRVVTGEKIKEYRGKYSDVLKRLPRENRFALLEQVILLCEDQERPDTEVGERSLHPEKSVDDVSKVRYARMDLWRRKVANMWLNNDAVPGNVSEREFFASRK